MRLTATQCSSWSLSAPTQSEGHSRVTHPVQVERGEPGRRVDRVVECKLNHGESLWSRARGCRTDTAQSVFEHPVDTLRPFIRLGMVSSRHVQPRSKQLEQRLPERSGKPRVTVRDEGLRKTMMAEDAILEQPSGLFASDRAWHRSKMHHLAQPTHEHQMPVLPWSSAGSPKTKPRLIDFQQSAGTGRLCKGAEACPAGFTR
ncbi:hypothetical protein PI125_g26363 [Phytophthora idaei]|nr:hypothetical protein PI125_g26363 [Phytophthora idaei]